MILRRSLLLARMNSQRPRERTSRLVTDGFSSCVYGLEGVRVYQWWGESRREEQVTTTTISGLALPSTLAVSSPRVGHDAGSRLGNHATGGRQHVRVALGRFS